MSPSNRYFDWLVGLVGGSDPHNQLFLQVAHNVTFYEVIPNDINRAEDGLALREQYPYPTGLGDCTFLEMLIALSNRVQENLFEYQTSTKHSAGYWFWVMVDNLSIDEFMGDPGSLEERLIAVVERRYDASGDGGLFPLEDPPVDQRRTEIWYQMMYWLEEFDTYE